MARLHENIVRTELTVLDPAKAKRAELTKQLDSAEREQATAVNTAMRKGRTIESTSPKIEALAAQIRTAERELRILERSLTMQRESRSGLGAELRAAEADIERHADAIIDAERQAKAAEVLAAHAVLIALHGELQSMCPDALHVPINVHLEQTEEVRRALSARGGGLIAFFQSKGTLI